jgi:hypothetical protein
MKEEFDDKAFEKQFKDRFEDFTSKPPENAWENILEKIQHTPQKPNSNGYAMFWEGGILLIFLSLCCLPPLLSFLNGQNMINDKERSVSTFNQFHYKKLDGEQKNEDLINYLPKNLSDSLNKFPKKTDEITAKNNLTSALIKAFDENKQAQKNFSFQKKKEMVLKSDSYSISYQRKNDNHLTDSVDVLNQQKSHLRQSTQFQSIDTLGKTSENESVIYPSQNKSIKLQNIVPIEKQPLQWNILSMDSIQYDSVHSIALRIIPTKEEEKQKIRPFEWTVFATPQYAYKQVYPELSDDAILKNLVPSNSFQKNAGYNLGLQFNYYFHKRLNVFAGVNYAHTRMQIDYDYTSVKADSFAVRVLNDTLMKVIPIYHSNRGNLKSTIHSLNFELGGKYLIYPKFYQFLVFGAGYHTSLSASHKSSENVSQSITKTGQWSLLLGYEMAYPIHKKLKLSVMPHIQYYFNSVYQNNAMNQVKPIIVGLRLGISKKL